VEVGTWQFLILLKSERNLLVGFWKQMIPSFSNPSHIIENLLESFYHFEYIEDLDA
jgi:hypothetical protein